jgi:hypothetical protein
MTAKRYLGWVRFYRVEPWGEKAAAKRNHRLAAAVCENPDLPERWFDPSAVTRAEADDAERIERAKDEFRRDRAEARRGRP